MPESNPEARRRELGNRLRQMRLARGLTVEEVAAQLMCSSPKISRLETGVRRATPADVFRLAEHYGVSDDTRASLLSLSIEARRPAWWTRHYDASLAPYIGLEQDAESIVTFSRYAVPTLLQTREYAEALIGITTPLAPRVLDEQVEAILRRQGLFDQRPSPRFLALLDESVLHRRVGSAVVMHHQLGRLLDLMAHGEALIRVLPFTSGMNMVVESNFQFLEFNDPDAQPPLLFIEGLFGNITHRSSSVIEFFRSALAHVQRIALSTQQSANLISTVRDNYA
jgi:transcriptional regulator with XRE-family HTH domain